MVFKSMKSTIVILYSEEMQLTFGRISASIDFVLCYKNIMFAVHNN